MKLNSTLLKVSLLTLVAMMLPDHATANTAAPVLHDDGRFAGFDAREYVARNHARLAPRAEAISHWAGSYRLNPIFLAHIMDHQYAHRVPAIREVKWAAEQLSRDFAGGLDVLAMILPDTPSTDRLVDGRVLECLHDGAILINTGRGNSLDLQAALLALRSGRLKAAVLDVLDEEPLADGDPLWAEPGVYITSHTSAPTEMDAIVDVFLDNLRRFEAGEVLAGIVDFERGY